MQSFYDYKKFAILYVDDEEKSLKYFRRAFEGTFRIYTASSAKEGYGILEGHGDEIGLLLTDQQMPGEKGVQLLERARRLRPRILRLLVTAFAEIDAAIDAVNTGAIYKYVSKPWDVPALEITLKRAMEFFIVQRERDHLLREKMSVLHNMLITDRMVSLGILAAGLGHHIRNALVAVRTFLELAPSKLEEEQIAMEDLRDPNFWREFYQHVRGQVSRINEMLSDLGWASEQSSQVFESEVAVKTVVEEVLAKVQPAFAEKSVQVVREIPVDLPLLRVDGPKFYRFFELLLTDEFVTVPDGAQIELRARSILREGREGNFVQIDVRDNGPGLPQDALRSVFDPFFLRDDNPQDFGIRLMTCYFIVYHHGGWIEVQSPAGKGTLFQIGFPTHPKADGGQEDNASFVGKVLMNENLWEKLISSN